MLTQLSRVLNRAHPSSLGPDIFPVGPGMLSLQVSWQELDMSLMVMLSFSSIKHTQLLLVRGFMRTPILNCPEHFLRQSVPLLAVKVRSGGLVEVKDGCLMQPK